MPENGISNATSIRWLRRAGVLMAGILAALWASAPSSVAAPYVPGAASISLSASVAAPGDTITVTLTGFTANVTFVVDIASTPVQIGSGSTDPSGSGSASVTIPSDTSAGNHEIIATDSAGSTASAPITIETTAAAAAVPVSVPGNGGGGLAFTGVPVLTVGSIGILLLAAGGLTLLAGRRRRVKA